MQSLVAAPGLQSVLANLAEGHEHSRLSGLREPCATTLEWSDHLNPAPGTPMSGNKRSREQRAI